MKPTPVLGLAILTFCASPSAVAQYTAIDLTPPSAFDDPYSDVHGNCAGVQVGSIGQGVGGPWMGRHASMWSSTLESVVDLTPNSDWAIAYGTDGAEQAGFFTVTTAQGLSPA